MPTVLVLLSTYNGDKFLAQQLDSLYRQKNVDMSILVRDDGSTDRTIEILNEYKTKFGKMTLLIERNVGAAKSFFSLMHYAANEMPRFDYYAFCDQDDIWYDDKLSIGISSLDVSDSCPQLFFSGVRKVDACLAPIGCKSLVHSVDNFYATIVSNHSLGCTQLFNYALLVKAALIYSSLTYFENTFGKIPLHDGWTIRVAYSIGAKVVHSSAPLMDYRQHQNNVVGSEKSWFVLMKKRVLRYLDKGSKTKSVFCLYLMKLYSEDICDEFRLFLRACIDYDKSLKVKAKLLFSPKLYQYGFVENIGLFFMIMFNRF